MLPSVKIGRNRSNKFSKNDIFCQIVMIASCLPKNEDEQIMSLFCTTTSKKPTQHLECPRLGSFFYNFKFFV